MTTGTMDESASARVGGLRAWIVWFLGANAFFYAFFERAAPSVMVDQLMGAFAAGAGVVGNLAALYLYIYALLQLPVGLLLDRWGPQKLLASGMAIAGLGVATFALADNIWVAYAGRLAIGAGSAVGFISALTLAAHWQPPHRFGLFSGMTMGYAMIGGFLAQGPLGALVESYGWRDPLLVTAVWGVVLAALIWLVVRDRPDGRPVQRTGNQSLGRSLVQAMSLGHNWVLAIYGLVISGPFLAYGLLWGVPHMMLYAPTLPLPVYQVLLFLVGLFGGSMILVIALGRELSPPSIGGAVTGFVNGAFVGGGALLQPIIGIVLDWVWDGTVSADGGVPVYTPANYDTALVIIPVASGIGFLLSLLMRESHCRPVGE
jgi:predicted MFS family arabinose efflux permease